MVFSPFVISAESGAPIDVIIDKASLEDLAATKAEPVWQTDWTSAYLADPTVEKAAIKTPDGELIGMGPIRSEAGAPMFLSCMPRAHLTAIRPCDPEKGENTSASASFSLPMALSTPLIMAAAGMWFSRPKRTSLPGTMRRTFMPNVFPV